MSLDLARWLPEFPVRDTCLYLNHAAVAPLPTRVAAAMRAQIDDQTAHGSNHWERWHQAEMGCRAHAAELLGCNAADITLVRSTSEGLSMVTEGLPWQPGDAVLVGEEDFAANVACYLNLGTRGVEIRRFPAPGGRVDVATVEPLLTPPVKVLGLSWVAFHTGWVAPVAELARIARERGILVVLDAIQGLGALAEGFAELRVDALVADGHKWLLAPEGLGVMATTPELRARLRPVLAGWLNTTRKPGDMFLDEVRFHSDGRRFEPGATPNVLVAGLQAALDLLLEAGIHEVQARVVAHARAVTHALLHAGWTVGSPGSGHPIGGIVAGRHPFVPAEEVVSRLMARHIAVSARQGWVRFSPHFYATTGELDALQVILRKI